MMALKVLSWLVIAFILAPPILGLLASLQPFATSGEETRSQEGFDVMDNWVVVSVIAYFAAAIFFLVPYGLILGAWARFARGTWLLERSRTGICVLTAILALPAALTVALVSTWEGDLAGSIFDWASFIVVFPLVFLSTWAGLFLPRALIPALGPGAFVGRSRIGT